jgi:signal transduction histidine kinase
MAPRGPAWIRGVGSRIALVAILTTLMAVGIIALGVTIVGAQIFMGLMTAHGESTERARAMFDASVTIVVVAAVVAATLSATALAVVLGRRLAYPLHEIGVAARRIAAGDYAARVPIDGPAEVADLGASFNQMAEALEEQERMRRDFIANAAHELRTPLTNLQGYLEALRDGVIHADRATYESLYEEADRLVRLSRSLDTLAAGDAGGQWSDPVELDLVGAIVGAVELAAPGFDRAGIRVETDLPPELTLSADPDGLAQVLGNLLQNALRYTPPGGSVIVRAERQPDAVVVSVANSGDGIPEADLAHVFERFYRVEKSRDRGRGGAGIGLAIVQQAIEAAGGRVGVESVDGLTRFWFSLPARPSPTGHGRGADAG